MRSTIESNHDDTRHRPVLSPPDASTVTVHDCPHL